MAERVGFELCQVLWILQLPDSKVPTLPGMPALPSSIARYCPLKEIRFSLSEDFRKLVLGLSGTSPNSRFGYRCSSRDPSEGHVPDRLEAALAELLSLVSESG